MLQEEDVVEDTKKNNSLLNYVEIVILEAEKRANPLLNIREFFTAYLIETKVKDENCKGAVKYPDISLIWRRYSEFEQLKNFLQHEYVYVIIPPLPEKKQTYAWRNPATNIVSTATTDPDFVDRRRAGLENFLHRVANHPILCEDKLFYSFLTSEAGWNESLKCDGYMQMVESKFNELSVVPRILTDAKLEKILRYAKRLQNSMDRVLTVRAKCVEKTATVDALHGNLGKLYSEWSVLEKNMGDGLQKAGHFIDTIVAANDTAIQDEDMISDQLKEYLFYAESTEAMVKNRTRLLSKMSQMKREVHERTHEKERLMEGKSTLMDRLFGAVQTKQARDGKIQQTAKRIEDGESLVNQLEDLMNNFTEFAVVEFERFQKQKDHDIKDTISTYVSQQVKIAKMGFHTWTNIKNCIEAIP